MSSSAQLLNETLIRITPYSQTIGAEVDGVDLQKPLERTTRDQLYAALLEWKVLFFRDQSISTEQHLAFASNFGELEVHPFAPSKPGYPEVLAITHDADAPGQENEWHSDVTWRQEPSLGSILRCIESPERGGDTLFADMYAAYEGLPEHIKEAVEGKVALHDFAAFRRRLEKNGATEAELTAFDEKYPNPEHPIIRTHPDTGRQGIYVNRGFTRHIVGMKPEDSERLLETLYRQAWYPEYQCRFRWAPNSIAFWDNRACQHYAASDYWPAVRRVERVTIIGDKPFYKPQPAAASSAVDTSPFRGQIRRSRFAKA
ncbi:MAG: TauD/TfdA family dioxygenase [Gammaproteobacteria bacterium]|nr:TauD/TfdA family dioxygenase [Gammaproteobacteria bacterium]